MDIGKRDLNIQKLQKELEFRRKLLLDKRDDLRQVQGENKYLVDVANDYEKYYKAIKKERERQYIALTLLSQYIDKISSDTATTDKLVYESRMQQREITKEIDRLREELDKMID